ncbi:hypothetical protein DICPUDRAFT_148868 [Dictyostelium purpureum]|uniref:RING-type domain-containing protein n=1 Tax=Dictyostelium purpureum TaxID=5786 RepID=F0ZC76_DICPU|nr:uncharacterized protein DICPUDRAFT_148868 [Dictyostelium purpureum]EGC38473.1 hypothetical protein DICPUDRAFT_148868 [Dictyostelium purpureum]|eukprot:XP_003285031.1 hypothetical protein DICPUDRAFT_148868 [Dictyostelium purpureum]
MTTTINNNNHNENNTSTALATASTVDTTLVPKLVIDDLDNILLPIGGGSRVKYTCLDVSKRYLALGATTGSLYFFERKSASSIFTNKKQILEHFQNHQHAFKVFTNDNISFTQILSLNDIRDQISIIKINPINDNLVAVATLRTLYIIESNISKSREKEKILAKMTDHPKDSEITSIIWSRCGNYLFSGDDSGNIFCCSVVKARKAFFFSGELVYKCDSKIVQLDIIPTISISNGNSQPHSTLDSQLNQHNQPSNQNIVITTPLPTPVHVQSINVSILSSTLTKSMVLNYQILTSTNSGKLQSTTQIGKKLRENTKQGACFHPFYKGSVYTSRPGKRLWLADPIDGKVLSTMNFTPSEDGVIVKPKPLITSANADADHYLQGKFPMIFSKLLPFGNYLVSYDDYSLLLIDVNEVEVLEWKLDQSHIHDLVVYQDSIYVLHGQQRSISRIFTSIPIIILPPDEQKEEENESNLENQNENNEENKPIIEQPQIIAEPAPEIEKVLVEENNIIIESPSSSASTSLNNSIEPEFLKKDEEANLMVKNNSLSNLSESLSENDITLTDSLSNSTEETINHNPVPQQTILKFSNDSDIKKNEQPLSAPIQITSTNTTVVESSLSTSPTSTIEEQPQVKKTQKESIFSDIPLSSEPLISKEPTLSVPRKVIKKKIKVQPPASSTAPSQPPATTVNKPSATNENSTATTNEEGTTKRTVIIKKKIVKKAPSSVVSSPPIGTTPVSPVNTSEPVVTIPQPTPVVAIQPDANIDQQAVITSTTANLNATTQNFVQQGKEGIFKTLNSATSSLLEIKQFALNKTNDITHKFAGAIGTTTSTGINNTNGLVATNITPVEDSASPPPAINIHPLEALDNLTKKTYESLLSFKENKNKESFEVILSIWAHLFNSIEDVPANEMIKEIVTSCFIMGINLNQCKETESSKHQLCKCWDESIAKEFIKSYFNFLHTNKIYINTNEKQWDSCIETLLELESFTKQESKIISTIYQFLDTNDSSTCLSLLDSHLNDYGLLFRFIDPLLQMSPKEASIFFAKQYPVILPRNIFQFINNNQQQQDTNSTTALTNIIKFEYLNQLMNSKPECKLNSNLLIEWFDCTLQHDKPDSNQLFLSLDNGERMVPRLGSFKVEWKSSSAILLQIIENTISPSGQYNGDIKYFEEQCKKEGFFQGLYHIYSYYNKIYSLKSVLYNEELLIEYSKKLVELTVYCDNKQGFLQLFETNTNIEIWSFTLETMKSLRNFVDKEFEYYDESNKIVLDISESFIIELMGKAIGPLETIELICKYNNNEMFEKNKISTGILSDWINFGKWSLYNRSKLSYDILSNLDSHLWLKKPLTLSPQILSILTKEINLNQDNNNNNQHNNNNSLKNLKNNIGQFDFSLPQFFEDNSRRHWGVETELQTGICQICTLPLAENPESSFLGSTPATIIVFPNCGHSYHHCCIEEQTCMLCFSKNK